MARPNQNRRGGKNAPRGGGGRNQGQGSRAYLEPPTQRQLNQKARAQTQSKFKPLERAISGDLRASERRVGEQGDWWANYNTIVNQGRADTQAAYQQAAATGQAQMAQASQVDNANTGTLNDEAAKSAALRGANTSTAPQERAAAAQAQRNYLAAAQGNATAQAGAHQFAYLTDQMGIGAGQRAASGEKEQRRGTSIRQDLRNTRQERGSYKVAKLGEGEDKARTYLLQRGAFGLDKQKQSADEREGAADRAIDQQNADTAAKNAATTARNAGKGGGDGGFRDAYSEAQALWVAAGRPNWSPEQWTKFRVVVASKAEISPSDAARAVKALRRKVQAKQGAGAKKPSVVGTVLHPGTTTE